MRRRRNASTRPQVIADGFEDRRLVALPVPIGEFDQRLDKLGEKRVTGQASLIEKRIDLCYIARFPELHKAVDTIDHRHRPASDALQAECLSLALIPAA